MNQPERQTRQLRARAEGGTGPSMLFVAPFPPPVHGQSLATVAIEKAFSKAGFSIERIDVSGKLARKVTAHATAALRAFFRSQVVYLSVNSNAGIWLTTAVALAARLRGSRILLHHHAYSQIRKRGRRMVALAVAAGPKAVHVVLGERMARDLVTVVPEVKHAFVLNNAGLIEDTLHGNAPSTLAQGIVLGHLSNLTEDKGISDVVRLAVAAKNRGTDVRLRIAGPVGDAAAREQIATAERELGGRFEYLGPVYGPAKADFFGRLSWFVFPSRYKNEASPLVLLEAIAAGVPCLTLDRGCIVDTISADEGLVVDAGTNFVDAALGSLASGHHNAQSAAARAKFEKLVREHKEQLAQLVALCKAAPT